jgi:hypothetical protein
LFLKRRSSIDKTHHVVTIIHAAIEKGGHNRRCLRGRRYRVLLPGREAQSKQEDSCSLRRKCRQ